MKKDIVINKLKNSFLDDRPKSSYQFIYYCSAICYDKYTLENKAFKLIKTVEIWDDGEDGSTWFELYEKTKWFIFKSCNLVFKSKLESLNKDFEKLSKLCLQ